MTTNHEHERKPATSIGELDVHLSYVQRDLALLAERLSDMATSDQIRELRDEMKTFATRKELEALEQRVARDSTETKIDTITRWAKMIVMVAAALGVVAAAIRLWDKLPA